MESEQLYHRGYSRNSYNSIASASSDEELLDGAGVIMDFHTTEDDNLLDGDASSPGRDSLVLTAQLSRDLQLSVTQSFSQMFVWSSELIRFHHHHHHRSPPGCVVVS